MQNADSTKITLSSQILGLLAEIRRDGFSRAPEDRNDRICKALQLAHDLLARPNEGYALANDDTEDRPMLMMGTIADSTDQVRREALVENERGERRLHRRMAALMAALPVGVHISEDATCEHVTGNPIGLAMFEARDGENLSASASDPAAFGRRIRILHHGRPLGPDELPLQLAVAENRVVAPMELEVLLPSGKRLSADASAAPIRDEEGNVVGGVAVLVDVTGRKQIEEDLRRERMRQELVVKSANVGVWYCPLPFDKLIWDATVKAHFHLPPDAEVTIETFYERIHPDDRERTRQAIELSIGQRAPYDIDYRTVSPDGKVVHWIRAKGRGFYDERGNAIRFDGITIDATGRKRAEEAIRASSEQYRNLFKSLLEGFCIVELIFDDDQRPVDFRFLEVNPAFESQTGLTNSLGKTMRELAPTFEEYWYELYGQVALSGEPVRAVHESKALGRWYDVAAYRVGGAGSRKVAILFNDVTDSKRAEEHLQTAKLHAERASEAARAASAAKDRFLAVLSHELRTPLTPVLAAVELLEIDRGLSPEQRESLQMIRRNVELESRLIDDLLDITRISHNKLELRATTVDVHQKIREVLEICRSDAEAKQLSLVTDLSADHHLVRADPARFQQIVWNLLRNAVKFTPAGGRVTIRTLNDEAKIRLTVADTGIGMDAGTLPGIFEAFEQGSEKITREFGGLGLGLAITRALVELHGGRISATSPGRGQGATFHFEMPIEKAPPAPDAAARVPETQRLSCVVLLVEDHADSRRVLAKLLARLGCQVKYAGSVREALECLGKDKFDLLISDLGLPDADGTELMRQARGLYGLRGIALSGYGMAADVERCREAGFGAHLTKPVNLLTLEDAIRQLMEP